MGIQDLKKRTKDFALQIIRLVSALPLTQTGRVLGTQLLRAGTSVGANYRAACRARTQAEFIAKLGIVIEEADECCFWIELILESEVAKDPLLSTLLKEANEITAIMVASKKSATRSRVTRK